MANPQIAEIERNIKAGKAIAELGKALDRLRVNKDFKKVITEGYLEQEAIRLVHLKADPNFQTPERKAFVLASIDAIGGLVQYLNTVGQRADMADNSVAADERALEEVLAEELTND